MTCPTCSLRMRRYRVVPPDPQWAAVWVCGQCDGCEWEEAAPVVMASEVQGVMEMEEAGA